jgi:DNA-binding CsgD family transcriptional regulator
MIPDAVRTLLDLSNVPTILLGGPDGVISYANPEALAVLGRPDEPTSGRSLEELSHHDDRQRLSQAVRECAGVHGARRYVRHRFLDQSRDVVSTDVALIGCGDWVGAGVSVLLEMRDLSITRSHNVFLRFLADVPPGDHVASALRHGPLALLPVETLSIYSINRDRSLARFRGATGFSSAARADYDEWPVSPLTPGGSVTLTGQHLWMSDTECVERFPLLAQDLTTRPWFGEGSIVVLPVISRGRTVGTVTITFTAGVDQTWGLYERLNTFAQSLAPWLLLLETQEMSKPEQLKPGRRGKLFVSPREAQILRLVNEGRTNPEIAGDLGYSEATIRADLLRLSKLLDVHGRHDVVRRARELGLYPE